MSLAAASLYEAEPASALDAIEGHRGPLLLDLDETLYLRNSTEDFIDSAQPGLLALLALRVLDLVRPWRWSGGEVTRDCWRVSLIAVLLPWTFLAWRRRCAALAGQFGNDELLRAIRPRDGVVVATIGFEPVVRPLFDAMGLPRARLVASRLWHFSDRRGGKLARATAVLGPDFVREALVLTDSDQDGPLLGACRRPLLTVWPKAHYRPALGRVYLPGQYISQVKHPGERYILRGILQEDFAFWVLASLGLSALPATQILGLGLLLVSFWAIYERGYVDNDLVAARHEEQPKLSAAYHLAQVATPPLQPWLWAAGCGAAALWLLRWPLAPTPQDALRWSCVLLATHGWFGLYNSYDKATRVWLYLGLQLARTAAFAVLVPVSAAGAAALGAHLFARWLPYYVYRCGSTAWPNAPIKLLRLVLFVLFCAVLLAAPGVDLAPDWTVAALLAWNLFRAWPELRRHWRAASRLDRGVPRGRA